MNIRKRNQFQLGWYSIDSMKTVKHISFIITNFPHTDVKYQVVYLYSILQQKQCAKQANV